jgi:DNA-binding NarL/FixJ family response regulator
MNPEATGTPYLRRRYRETPLPSEALELLADLLLAVSDQDAERPSYPESRLISDARRASNAEHYFRAATDAASAPSTTAPRLPDEDGLSGLELSVWRMYRDGVPMMHIAEHLGLSRHLVKRHIRNVLRRTAAHGSPGDDLREVYLSEVTRQEYRKPAHCTGEPCRRLGYCKYAGRKG